MKIKTPQKLLNSPRKPKNSCNQFDNNEDIELDLLGKVIDNPTLDTTQGVCYMASTNLDRARDENELANTGCISEGKKCVISISTKNMSKLDM